MVHCSMAGSGPAWTQVRPAEQSRLGTGPRRMVLAEGQTGDTKTMIIANGVHARPMLCVQARAPVPVLQSC